MTFYQVTLNSIFRCMPFFLAIGIGILDAGGNLDLLVLFLRSRGVSLAKMAYEIFGIFKNP